MPSAKPTKPTPKVERAATKPVAVSVLAHLGKLVIEVDADCELRVDGQRKLTLLAGEASVVALEAGQQLLECISTQNKEVKVRQVQTVKEGEKAVVSLALAKGVSDAAAKILDQENRMKAYIQALSRYKENMNSCPAEYSRYRDALKQEAEKLQEQCAQWDPRYPRYDSCHYSETNAGEALSKRWKTADERAKNAPYSSESWCNSRYSAPQKPADLT